MSSSDVSMTGSWLTHWRLVLASAGITAAQPLGPWMCLATTTLLRMWLTFAAVAARLLVDEVLTALTSVWAHAGSATLTMQQRHRLQRRVVRVVLMSLRPLPLLPLMRVRLRTVGLLLRTTDFAGTAMPAPGASSAAASTDTCRLCLVRMLSYLAS